MSINDALAKEYNRGLADGKASVEQKHGHWEISAYCNHKPYRLRHADKWTIWRCSVCGENNGRCHSDAYCRHCGAKMDEVTEDGKQ